MSKFQTELGALSEVLSRRTQEVLALFDDALSEVRFPDVDAEVLDALMQHVHEAHAEVEHAERALEAARARRAGHIEALDAVVLRALAYARVFSEGDPSVRERVQSIDRDHGAAPAAAPAGKRGRPKKRAAVESDLFDEADPCETMEAQPALM